MIRADILDRELARLERENALLRQLVAERRTWNVAANGDLRDLVRRC